MPQDILTPATTVTHASTIGTSGIRLNRSRGTLARIAHGSAALAILAAFALAVLANDGNDK